MKKNKQVLNNVGVIKNNMNQKKEAVIRTVPLPPPVTTSTTVETTTIPENVVLEQPIIEEITTTIGSVNRLPNLTNKK
jgi:hypothetical protein